LIRAALLCVVFCGVARAELPERPARITVDAARVTLAVEFPELVDAALRRKLDSGLTTTVVSRAYVVREGFSRAEALAVQTVRVAYDLWDEVWVVEVSDENGRKVTREKRREDALRRLITLEMPVAETARLQRGARYRVAVIVELDPVSPALLAQVRKWLSRPREGAPVDSESYFGSFVSLFVNRKVGEAERVLKFRTAPFSTGAAP
jgi:hypothetical protein